MNKKDIKECKELSVLYYFNVLDWNDILNSIDNYLIYKETKKDILARLNKNKILLYFALDNSREKTKNDMINKIKKIISTSNSEKMKQLLSKI